MLLLLVEKISSRETTIIENVTYHVSTTSVLDESFNTSLSKTNKTLLFFIKMIGGIDIILLAAYVAMFIYDQRRGEKVAKFICIWYEITIPSNHIIAYKI